MLNSFFEYIINMGVHEWTIWFMAGCGFIALSNAVVIFGALANGNFKRVNGEYSSEIRNRKIAEAQRISRRDERDRLRENNVPLLSDEFLVSVELAEINAAQQVVDVYLEKVESHDVGLRASLLSFILAGIGAAIVSNCDANISIFFTPALFFTACYIWYTELLSYGIWHWCKNFFIGFYVFVIISNTLEQKNKCNK